jgi:hypothetical protein
MMIALIDYRDLDAGPGQAMGHRQAAEAGADDDHMVSHAVTTA